MYTLLSILRPDVFNNFFEFGNRYCDPKQLSNKSYCILYDGCSNTKELNYILNRNLMIRRLKKDVLTELPSKTR